MPAPWKVMVVEDNPIHLKLMTMFVESLGYQCIPLAGGRMALEETRKHCPDVVLCDIMMEGVDGFAYARLVRSITNCPDTVLIAVSAVDEKLRQAAIDRDFDYFVRKPVNPAELEALLADIFARKTRPVNP